MKRFRGLIVEINRQCNFSCFFCPVPIEKTKKELPLTKIKELLESKEVERYVLKRNGKFIYLGIGGGEPLLHSSINEIIELFSNKSGYVVLSTNLSKIPDGFMDVLASHENVIIQVSLHASNPELFKTITRVDAFMFVLNNIRRLIERVGSRRVLVNTVVSEKNEDDVFNIFHVLRKLGVSKLRLHPMIVDGRAYTISPAKLKGIEKEIIEKDLPFEVELVIPESDGEIAYITMDGVLSNNLFTAYKKDLK